MRTVVENWDLLSLGLQCCSPIWINSIIVIIIIIIWGGGGGGRRRIQQQHNNNNNNSNSNNYLVNKNGKKNNGMYSSSDKLRNYSRDDQEGFPLNPFVRYSQWIFSIMRDIVIEYTWNIFTF